MLRARVIGRMDVEVDGRPLPPLPGLRPRSLLAYLLLHPGLHPRGRLAAVFWPDVLDTSARASLRSALWTVRTALEAVGGADLLAADRAAAGISPDAPREVDVDELAALAARQDRASLERAAGLGLAPLLPDLADEWVLRAQNEHRERMVGVVARLAALAERDGDHAGAVDWTRRALDLDRLREATHRDLMRRLAAAGERAGALDAYRRMRDLLAVELGIAPSPEARALAEALRRGHDAAPPPAPAPPPRAAAPDPLVGRRVEREALAAAWAGAGRDASVAVVGGEAGIGKTRLVADLEARARAGGAVVVVGGTLDLDGAPPFGPWSEALRALVEEGPVPPPGASWPADLARLCPVAEARWGVRASPAAGGPDVERARLFEAVGEALRWRAQARRVLVVLEDVHRADAASLALTAHVGRTLAGVPVLLVLTRRVPGGEPELEGVLDALRRRGALGTEIPLGPLAADDLVRVAAAAAPGLDAAGARRAAAAADGNPLLAREGARALAAGSDPAEGLRAWTRAPLARLPGPARELVDLAAAAGRPLRPQEGAALMGLDGLAVAQEAATAGGLLAVTGDGAVRFPHALLRDACYAEAPAARRLIAHRRLAEALASGGQGGAAEVARHLRLAGDRAGAQRHLVAAARSARALGALDETARFLREAAGLADGDRRAEAEIWLELADAEAWRGRRETLEEAFAQARALLGGSVDAEPLAAALIQRGRWFRTTVCYPAQSAAAYDEAVAVLDRMGIPAPELRALAAAGRGWVEAVAGDPGRVEALLAAAATEAAADPLLAAEAELARALALMRSGRLDEAGPPSLAGTELALRAGRRELACTGLANLAAAAACAGDVAGALACADRALAIGGAGPEMEATLLAARAYALSRLGRHDEARSPGLDHLALARRFGLDAEEATAQFDLGSLALAAGDWTEAADRLQAALDGPTRRVPRPLARLRRAEALAMLGDVAGAEAELGEFPFEPVTPGDLPETLVPRLARAQGLVATARGDPALAARRLAEAEDAWRHLLASVALGDAYAANIVDLGRPPVAGLVEPARELEAVVAERASLAPPAATPRGS